MRRPRRVIAVAAFGFLGVGVAALGFISLARELRFQLASVTGDPFSFVPGLLLVVVVGLVLIGVALGLRAERRWAARIAVPLAALFAAVCLGQIAFDHFYPPRVTIARDVPFLEGSSCGGTTSRGRDGYLPAYLPAGGLYRFVNSEVRKDCQALQVESDQGRGWIRWDRDVVTFLERGFP